MDNNKIFKSASNQLASFNKTVQVPESQCYEVSNYEIRHFKHRLLSSDVVFSGTKSLDKT